MKAIQITIDEPLLAKLDRDAEVRRDGRSAVFRRAVSEYLKRARRREIAAAYARGYASAPAGELEGWAQEGSWPEE